MLVDAMERKQMKLHKHLVKVNIFLRVDFMLKSVVELSC